MYAEDYQAAMAGADNQAQADTAIQAQQAATDKRREDDAMKAENVGNATAENTAMNGGVPLEDPTAPPMGIYDHTKSMVHSIGSFMDTLIHHGKKADAGPPIPPPNSSPAPSSPDANAAPAGTPPAGAVPSPAGAQAPAGASSPDQSQPPAAASPGAVPPPATGTPAQAIPSVAADPTKAAAVASNPQQAGAAAGAQVVPPRSMTHVDWHDLDLHRQRAQLAALRAGKDPVEVGKAMDTMRTAFIQSGMLKYAAAANTALMQGDQAGLKRAMENMNYFLPNGQDLKTHEVNGQLEYIDPFTPTTADGKPNYVPVTLQHIQLLAQNLTDPLKVQDTINAAVTQGAKIAHETAQDKALQTNADAAKETAHSKATNANTHRALAPGQDLLNRARAQAVVTSSNAAAARAAAAAKGAVTPALANTAANAASKAAEDAQQGIMETNTNEDSLQYGKPMRNNEKIAPWYKGADGKKMGPGDLNASAAFAGKIGAANVGTMPASEAAEIGGQIFHKQHVRMTTHKGPDGKPVNDVQAFPATNQLGLWVPDAKGGGGHFRYINAYPQLIDEMQSGTDQAAAYNNIYAPAEGGSAEDDDDAPPANPADTATAVPPPPPQ